MQLLDNIINPGDPSVESGLIPEFKGLNIDSILGEIKFLPSWKNLHLSGFVNNNPVPISPEELKDWKNLQKSFRITNIQLVNSQINSFCQRIYEMTKKVLIANLYFTPHQEAQCFNIHADEQNIFVYQILGSKQWSFFKFEGKFLKELDKSMKVIKLQIEKLGHYEEQVVSLKQAETLSFGYCYIHQVRNITDQPSLHLTFSWEQPTKGGLAHYIMDKIKANSSENYFQSVSLAEFQSGLTSLEPNLVAQYLAAFQTEQMLRLKEGKIF